MANPVSVSKALTRLVGEISLNRPFTGLHEGAFLSLVWTWQRLEQVGRRFFPGHGITEAQFNVLMILDDYGGRRFRQHELAEILVVNRASAGSVLEKMERSGWIERKPDPDDRRAMLVSLSRAGKAKLAEVRGPYYELLGRIFEGVPKRELQELILLCDRLRRRIDEVASDPTGGKEAGPA
ncbi:MAG TPA: MarR family transcriptional regulator [Usitatibacter sp.]|nr:MarR family transcriptional regulator [Usitatibacter sp.]